MIAPLQDCLERIVAELPPVALASSLSAEDMVLTDAIAAAELPVEIFVLDTGRLHGDTLCVVSRIESRYGIRVSIFRPQPAAVQAYVQKNGSDGFYRSVELRKQCCAIRKVEPLARALRGKRAWITGQRRAHSAGRSELPEREFDAVHAMEKFNPLASWTEADVWHYIRARGVSYNALYDQGYRSIGCAPCTRPVLPDEDVRAGRWWWESPEHRECGLHVQPAGRASLSGAISYAKRIIEVTAV
jgi:phosphoadenosine phosphosulfate reductase